jgi:hypothetical protein
LADALQLAELVRHVVEAAVVLEREDGTDWQEIDRRYLRCPRPACPPAVQRRHRIELRCHTGPVAKEDTGDERGPEGRGPASEASSEAARLQMSSEG